MTKLTDLKVRNSKAKDKRYSLSDNGGGLWLVVQPSGHKSYVTMTRLKGGKQIKLTHGETDALSLADARALSAEAIKQAKQGTDPREAKRLIKAKRQIAEANTFEAIALSYLDRKEKEIRTGGQVRDRLTRLTFPLIGAKPVADVKRSHVAAALDHIARTSGATAANRTLSDIRCVLNFYADRDDDYRPPRLSKLSRKTTARDRILTDDEIRRVWATGDRFARFLLLSTARREEVASMTWKELDGSNWLLPARRHKNKTDLLRPLSRAAMALLPERGADDEYVLGHTPDRPVRGFVRLKARLDAASGVRNFTYHDLRRSGRSLMSRAGISSDIAEMVLGHTLKGVRAVYDRHSYAKEKAHALEALAHQIKLITDPPKGNVHPIKRKRA